MCLQETFLSKQDLSCLNVIHKDFQGIEASNTDTRYRLITEHPNAGVPILYKLKHPKCMTPIHVNLDWVIVISIDNAEAADSVHCRKCQLPTGAETAP